MKKLYAAIVILLMGSAFLHVQAQNDFSLNGFSQPALSHYCIGSSVYNHVILADSGGTGIGANAVYIHWTLSDGTSGLFNGPESAITPDGKDTLALDTFTFARPGAYLLTVYLDSADTNHTNDTIRTIIHVSMNGLYTVNPLLPSAGNNFQTLTAACDTLSAGGVCGPVIIEIEDGDYTGQARISNVAGVSATNNIIIRSASQDSASVSYTFTPTGATDNYVIAVNGTSYVTIEDLTLKNTGNASYARVLTIDSTCAYNQYRNLHLMAPVATVNSNALAVIYSNPGTLTNDSMSVFENNIIENGAYGMYLYGASSAIPEDSLIIRKNTMVNPYVAGIFMYYQSNTIIDSNVVTTTANTSNFSGLYMRYGKGNVAVTRNTIIADGAAGDLLYIRDFSGSASAPILIANNFLLQKNNTATLRGIYPYNCNYVDVAFNTVRMQSGSTTAGRALYINSSAGYGNIRLLNNNIENIGGGYAIEISATSISNNYVSQCDYNNFNVNGTYLGKYGSTNCTDIAAWLTAATTAGFDTHSVEIDPVFSGTNTFEFTNAALNNLGLPMATVTDDILGTARNLTNPDMGAYEFELLGQDMIVLSVDAPQSGCGMSAAENVQATFYNNGSVDETSATAQFSIDGGTTWSTAEALPTILSGASLPYTFTQTANLSTPGMYNVHVRITSAGDENTGNNRDSAMVSSVISINTFPYSESFESGNGNWTAGGTNNSWQLGEPENTVIDTASAGTQCWVTNLTGNYNVNELSYVQSPCFDLSAMADPWLEMDVWYEAEGGWDGAQVQYSTDGGNSWQTLGAYGDTDWYNDYDVDGIANNAPGWTGADANGSNEWMTVRHRMLPLTAYSGIRLRVLFGSGNTYNEEGFAFDNIHISDRGVDAAITFITNPTGGCDLATSQVHFIAANAGTVTLTQLPVSISINGGTTWTADTISTNIISGSNSSVISNQMFDFSGVGQHEIVVKSTLLLDINHANDSATRTVVKQPQINAFPYFENFESGLQTWMTTDTLWQPGTPSGLVINSAYSGTTSWSTCNNGFTQPLFSSVESPCFDFSDLSMPQVEFRYFVNISSYQGVMLQYTTDNNIWNSIGNIGDTLNWYNSNFNPFGDDWSGDSMTTWELARHAIPQLAGASFVKFRFLFAYSVPIGTKTGNDGFAFDDFSVYERPDYDLAMIAMDTLYDACEHGTDSITVWMQNTNFTNIIPAGDTIAVALNEGWLNVVMDTIVLTSPIMPQQTISHTFSVPLDMTAHPYTYMIEVQLYNTHDVESTNNSLTQTVESFGYPVVELGSDTAFCGNGHITLDGGPSAGDYEWSTGDVTRYLIVDTSLTGGYGSFPISVVVSTYGCSSSDSITITFNDCTGLNEMDETIRIYPNPAQNLLYYSLPQSFDDAEVLIRDLTGRTMMQQNISGKTDGHLNILFLPEGVYLLQIKTATSNHTQQIVIQH